MSGSRLHNPFEDIPSQQRQAAPFSAHDDPFEDANGSPQLFSPDNYGPPGQASSSRDPKHGYALDPFFDEYVNLWVDTS